MRELMVPKKKDLDRVLLFDIQRPFFRQKSICTLGGHLALISSFLP